MGTGWRRAFRNTSPKDPVTKNVAADPQIQIQIPNPSPSPRTICKLGFFSSKSNPSTPRMMRPQPVAVSTQRLRCRTSSVTDSVDSKSNQPSFFANASPKLGCKTASNTPKSSAKSPRSFLGSNPSSPRSPFSIFKNTLRLSRNGCGICMQSVKMSHGTAIYRAECSHVFHFPCIAAHVRKQGSLICPVCKTAWKDEPLLAIHKLQQHYNNDVEKKEGQTRQHTDGKSYSDDEPLLSPTAGGPFIPIPETEDEEELIEEFQGFFTDSVTPSLNESKNYRDVEARLMPDVAIISVSRTHETYAVVLKVRAPPTPPSPPPAHFTGPSRRAPIDLVTVLDVGGSMGGAKLQMLKRAMRLVISSLGPADRLSIIAFSAYPERLLPLRRMTIQGQRLAQRIINQLECSHGSSAGDALRRAAKILEDRRERNPVASIILLSDGQEDGVNPNNSNQRQEYSHVSSTRFAHIEIPTQSFCYGEKAGGYRLEPADEDAFTKCVGGLLSVVVQDVRIQLGSDPAEICAVYSSNGRPTSVGSGTIMVGDLYAEEERELLIELRVPRCGYGSHNVLSVISSHKDPATQRVRYGKEQTLLVPLPLPLPQASVVPKIQRLRFLFLTTRAIAESLLLVEHNELPSAQRLLLSTRALLVQSGSKLADEYIRGLQAELEGINWRRQYQQQQKQIMIEKEVGLMVDENGDPLTPTSAWRAAQQLAKVAATNKSFNRVSDLHGFENARF